MKKFLSVEEAMKQGSGQVNIRGWCYRCRHSSQIGFIVVRDVTNIIQCVIDKSKVSEQIWKDVVDIGIEASLEVVGTIREEKRAPSGYELDVVELKIVGPSQNYPITKDFSTEFLLDNRHLWIRSRKMVATFKIRSTLFRAIDDYFREQNFYEFPPPIFTPNACEGGNTLFKVKYFDNDVVYLTQSWQLYAEAGIFSLEKIYCVSPCFRAERSKTSRHLAEFWMAEMEMAWMHLDTVVYQAKGLIKRIIKEVVTKHEADLKLLGQDVEKLRKIAGSEFPTITYTKALEILKEKEGMEVEWGKDLRTVEEELLMKHFDTPVVVTNYPKEIMAFYKPKDPADPKTALCFDMLAPEGYGEIIGGSERDWNVDELITALKKEGENIENYQWYLDLRRYGSVPHSGFGMGVERITAWLCKLENIKDAIPFPRTMLRKRP